MKEYLVEVLDQLSTNYIYVWVIAKSKEDARKKVYAERGEEIEKINTHSIQRFVSDFKVQKAYEINKEIMYKDDCYPYYWFGNFKCFDEDDVYF